MGDLSISTFKGVFKGGARPNLYQIRIPDLGATVEFLAKASTMPTSTIDPIEVPFMGRILKLAGNRTFADWTVTVINDVDFDIRRKVEAWMGDINSHETNQGFVDPSGYMRDATVRQLDQSGAVLYTYEFRDIWPMENGEITLGMEENNSLEEFTITFAIGTYWQSDGVK